MSDQAGQVDERGGMAGAMGGAANGLILRARGVRKTYRLGRNVEVPVLHGVDIDVKRGEWIAILGASGSGKSTLLHLLGGLDRVDAAGAGGVGGGGSGGEIEFEGKPIQGLSARALDAYRSESVGFVFQFYHLLPELSVVENVALATLVRRDARRIGKAKAMADAREVLVRVGLEHRLKHRSAELSGGERQRVAIARALLNRPPLLLADEPTGNLDQTTGDRILETLTEIRKERALTVLMVTHDSRVAARADRMLTMIDGRMVS